MEVRPRVEDVKQEITQEAQQIQMRQEKQSRAEFSLHMSEKPTPYSESRLVDMENSSASHTSCKIWSTDLILQILSYLKTD